MTLHSIDTGYFKLDGGAMFGVVPKTIWQNINPSDEKNLCNWALRCLLIEDGNRLMLIDCGLGNKQSEKFFSYYEPHGEATLDSSLKEIGFHADDITDVLLTHLHFDHCGGAIKKEGENLIPAFKNATYYCNERHWSWAVNPNARERASFLKENILPIQQNGKLKMLQDGEDVMPNVSVQFVYGHTEAMMIPIIKYKEQYVAYVADLIPSAAHIAIPYVMAYDVRPLVTIDEKEKFLRDAAAKNFILFFEHDRSVEACSITAAERGVKMKEEIHVADL